MGGTGLKTEIMSFSTVVSKGGRNAHGHIGVPCLEMRVTIVSRKECTHLGDVRLNRDTLVTQHRDVLLTA